MTMNTCFYNKMNFAYVTSNVPFNVLGGVVYIFYLNFWVSCHFHMHSEDAGHILTL